MFLPFLPFILPILAENVPLISPNFLKWSLVFLILLFRYITLHCFFKKALSRLASLWNFAFSRVYAILSPLLFTSLLLSAMCKVSSANHFAFVHFFFFVMVLVTVSWQCCKPLSVVLQALYLLDLIPSICLSLPKCNHKGFDLGHTWMT